MKQSDLYILSNTILDFYKRCTYPDICLILSLCPNHIHKGYPILIMYNYHLEKMVSCYLKHNDLVTQNKAIISTLRMPVFILSQKQQANIKYKYYLMSNCCFRAFWVQIRRPFWDTSEVCTEKFEPKSIKNVQSS